jgi:hypothetical protein
VINNTTTGPLVDGDRRLAYTWAFSAGVKREIARDMAVSIDYVGNRGRDNTGIIDINEGPLGCQRACDPTWCRRIRSHRRARSGVGTEYDIRTVQ